MAARAPKSKLQKSSLGFDQARARALVMEMMAIPGKSGQESATADYIIDKLRSAGVSQKSIAFDTAHKRSREPGGEIGNLIVKLPGTQRADRLLMSAHLDTVPICVGSQPKLEGNLVRSANPNTGLGADNRAGCAVVLASALEVLERGLPHPPMTLVWFVQEEIGLQGSRCITKSLLGKPAMGVNWDGGAPTKLTIGATGGYRARVRIQGLASHAGGAPEWGVSAVAIAALAIADLQQGGWHGLVRKGKRAGTSNVGRISGGEATNVVTDLVELNFEARSHNPTFRKRIVKEFEKAFARAVKRVKNVAGAVGSVEIDGKLDYESFRLKPKDPCVQIAQQAVIDCGAVPELAIANGGVDANWLVVHGIPTVSLGCGQIGQHMVSERLDIEQFDLACQIGLRIITGAAHGA